MRFALFTTECAQLGETIQEIAQRHPGELAAVVTSDIYGQARGGLARQMWANVRRSGPRFLTYLMYGFPAYFALRRVLAPGRRSVAQLCRRNGIPHLHTAAVNSTEVVDRLRALDLDFIVVYWFDQILRERLIAVPRLAVVNVHAAYLPNCRGLFPTLHSALEPGTPFGVTAHLIVDRGIDTGPVLARCEVRPPAGRSVLFTDAWVNRAGVDLLDEVLADFHGHVTCARQQSAGTYHSYPDRAEVRALRAAGTRLATLADFRAVCRGVWP
jgi:methionyl-tRNA formyltransferase